MTFNSAAAMPLPDRRGQLRRRKARILAELGAAECFNPALAMSLTGVGAYTGHAVEEAGDGLRGESSCQESRGLGSYSKARLVDGRGSEA